jgi:hypothetical protein
MNGGGELKIDPTKMEVIIKRPTPTNFIEVRIFLKSIQYLQKLIALFLVVATQLHAITINDESSSGEIISITVFKI